MSRPFFLACALFLAALPATAENGSVTTDWPRWRGPLGTGASPEGTPPLRWSESENVRFKVAVPGRGHASPVIWGEKIFLLTAVASAEAAASEPESPPEDRRPPPVAPAKHRFVVLALAREDGRTLWQRTALEEVPHEGHHADGTWASASPVTDGEVLIANFGSRGLFAYDLDGEALWQRDLGDMTTRNAFGEGASPALDGNTVVVNWDHEGDSFVVALDKKTGEERWRAARDDEPTSWSTPLIVEHGGRRQVVIAATGRTRGYDLATGKVLWQSPGMTLNVVPTPVAANGVVYVTSGFRGNALQAIRLAAAEGELEGAPAIVFEHDRHTPYVPSPVLYDGRLYFLSRNSAILTVLDAENGAIRYTEQRIEGLDNVYASPVAAAGRVYVAGRNGTTAVLRAGDRYELLATNTLDEGFDASPAIVGDALYLRGREHLYSLAEATAEKPASAETSP